MEKNWIVDYICEMRFIWYISVWNLMYVRMGIFIGSCFLFVFGLIVVFLVIIFFVGIVLILFMILVIVFIGMIVGK